MERYMEQYVKKHMLGLNEQEEQWPVWPLSEILEAEA